jgi:hypothetical protein
MPLTLALSPCAGRGGRGLATLGLTDLAGSGDGAGRYSGTRPTSASTSSTSSVPQSAAAAASGTGSTMAPMSRKYW